LRDRPFLNRQTGCRNRQATIARCLLGRIELKQKNYSDAEQLLISRSNEMMQGKYGSVAQFVGNRYRNGGLAAESFKYPKGAR
jgi:hypothetical protein